MKGQTNSSAIELVRLLLFLTEPRTLEQLASQFGCSDKTAERRLKELRSLGFVVKVARHTDGGKTTHRYLADFIASIVPEWRRLARLVLTTRKSRTLTQKEQKTEKLEPIRPDGEWRDVVRWEGYYQVSQEGQIWAISRVTHKGARMKSKLKKFAVDAKGRYRVILRVDDRQETKEVGLVVAEAFLGPKPATHHLHYADGNKANMALSNLSYRFGKNSRSKLSEVDVLSIRFALGKGEALNRLASRYGVSDAAIMAIRDGLSYTDASLSEDALVYDPTSAEATTEPTLQMADSMASPQKLSVTERIAQLIALRAQGLKAKQIAQETGLSVGTVYEYLSRAGATNGKGRTKFGDKSKAISVEKPLLSTETPPPK